MLKITVKTMDSQSRQFEVRDSISIKDFKETIAASVNVSASNQRLIYQGRVLQDEFCLTREHDGKVLHLVQRMPVVTTSGPSATNNTTPVTNSSANPSTSGNFNPSQLSHMIFQQAMNGLGNLLVGGSISGNMVQNPNNPNEQVMSIQIDLNGSGSNNRTTSASSTTGANVTTTSTTTSSSHSFRLNSPLRQHDHHNSSNSAPRLLLRSVDRNLTQLNAVINQLEALNASDSSSQPAQPADASVQGVDSSGDVFASELEQTDRPDEGMDVSQNTSAEPDLSSAPTRGQSNDANHSSDPSSTTTVTSSGSQPSISNHPTLSELGAQYSRLQQAQRRLDPFLTRMITFMNTDPAFNSTQAPEYQNAARFLSLSLQAQQLMAEIQRLLSRAVIPLGRTPPRTMLVRAPHSAAHQHHRIHADARRLHHAVHAGMGLGPRGPLFAPPRPSSGIAFRPGPPPSMIPVGGVVRQQVFPGGQGMQFRWRMPPSAPNTTGSARTTPTATATATVTTPVSSSSSRPTLSESDNANGSATVFTVQPPSYTVHVNATIQPHILFNVGLDSTPPTSTTTTSGGATTAPGNTARTDTATQNQTPSRPEAAQTASDWTTSGALPNIPGLQTGALSDLFQTIARSAQQQMSASGIPTSGTGRGGVILLQGPPGGQNQVPEDISNIIGQTVFDTVYSQLTATSTSSSTAPNVRVVLNNSNSTSAGANTTTTFTTTPQTRPTSSTESSSSGNDVFFDAMRSNQTSSSQSQSRQKSSSESKMAADQRASSNFTRRLRLMTRSSSLRDFNWDQNIIDVLPTPIRKSAKDSAESKSKDFSRDLMLELCRKFTCRQLFSALQGESELLFRLRDVIRKFTARSEFCGAVPTLEEIQVLSGLISEYSRDCASKFFANARCVPDVDIVESNLSLMRHSLKKALEIIFFSSDAVFPSDFGRHIRYWVSLWSSLNQSVLRGGKKELVKLIKNYKLLQEGVAHKFKEAVEEVFKGPEEISPLESFLSSLSSLYSGDQNEIDQFVLSEAPIVVESETNIATDVTDQSDVVMETASSSSHGKKSPKPISNSVPRSSAGPVVTDSSASEPSGSDWKKSVPEKWVDTIVADGKTQQNMEAQLPFSDAYIAGMPASKRRKVVS